MDHGLDFNPFSPMAGHSPAWQLCVSCTEGCTRQAVDICIQTEYREHLNLAKLQAMPSQFRVIPPSLWFLNPEVSHGERESDVPLFEYPLVLPVT